MTYVFQIKDKFGRKIHLSKERWHHILNHKGMENKLEDIKKTLMNPTIIIPHRHDENRSNYYLHYKEKKRYLLVAVKYLNGEGYVTTSFITRKIIKNDK